VLGSNTLSILITFFIVLNIISALIIVSACIISGRASCLIDPQVEAQMISQRELAVAVSKLRVINPEPDITDAIGQNLFFSPAKQVEIVGKSTTHSRSEAAIATSRTI